WYGDRYWGRIDATDRSTQSVSFMGELYLNFGVPAVLFGMFLLGLMYRAWYTYLFRWRSPVAVAIYVAALPTMLQIEGDFVLLFRTGINRVLTSIVAITLLAYLVRGTDKESATRAQVTH